jgi:hypothetical protein
MRMRTSGLEAAYLVEWDVLDVYDKLLRVINTGTHHVVFYDFQKINQEPSISRKMINNSSTLHESLSFNANTQINHVLPTGVGFRAN